MTADKQELRRLAQSVAIWASSLNKAWPGDTENQEGAWVVGSLDDEDGEQYPVIEIDAEQYYAPGESEKIARFVSAANPAVVLELLDEIEAARRTGEYWKAEHNAANARLHEVATACATAEQERDQLREIAMRLVDLQNGGRGPIRTFTLWNDIANRARQVLGLEVRNG